MPFLPSFCIVLPSWRLSQSLTTTQAWSRYVTCGLDSDRSPKKNERKCCLSDLQKEPLPNGEEICSQELLFGFEADNEDWKKKSIYGCSLLEATEAIPHCPAFSSSPLFLELLWCHLWMHPMEMNPWNLWKPSTPDTLVIIWKSLSNENTIAAVANFILESFIILNNFSTTPTSPLHRLLLHLLGVFLRLAPIYSAGTTWALLPFSGGKIWFR